MIGRFAGALLLLSLAGCVQTAANLRSNDAAGSASFTTDRPVNEAYSIVQANAVHCWSDAANYIIAGAPPSPVRPPSIQINSVLGHLMAVVDFSAQDNGTKVDARVGYSLANRSRTQSWQRALESWLSGSEPNYCPRMP